MRCSLTPLLSLIPCVAIACDSPGGGGGIWPAGAVDASGVDAAPHGTEGDGATASEDASTPETTPVSTDFPDTTPAADTTPASDTTPAADTTPALDTAPPARSCEPLGLTQAPPLSDVQDLAWIFGGVADLGLGGPGRDWFGLEYFSDATGTFDLSAEVPTGGGCVHCTLLVIDSGTASQRYLRPVRGTLVVDAPASGADFDATYLGVELVDETDLDSGTCYRAEMLHFEGTRGCQPQCAGKVCGDDGCGGSCGECGGGAVCNTTSSACVATAPPACTQLTVSGPLTVEGAGSFYIAPLGADAASTRLYVQTFVPELGVFDLASGNNTNYATCDQCVLLFEGLTASGFERAYFQTAGAISIAQGSDPLASTPRLDAQLLAVELREVELDLTTFRSSLVPGGACFTIPAAWVSTE